jgi:membrane-associated protein
MEELFAQVWQILVQVITHFTNPEAWKEALGNPAMVVAAFVVLNLIVFTETGLLFGFLLPGDSLLVTAGIVAHTVDWPIFLLALTLCIAAILGDTVGYAIGMKAGPAIFNRPSSRFFKRDHLQAARDFYELHGGKTIIIARFMPFIRTFAPVVAGAAKMEYKRFLAFNAAGGILWVCSMLAFGYTLHLWADAVLRPILGENFRMEKNIDILAIAIILVSISPIVWKAAKHWLDSRRVARAAMPITEKAIAVEVTAPQTSTPS